MDGGGVGELIGIALAGVGAFVGWRSGAKAERSFMRILILVAVGGYVLLLGLALIWTAIVGFE